MLDLADQMRHRRDQACERISNKLSSVSYDLCTRVGLRLTGAESIEGEPILLTELAPYAEAEPRGRVLLVGGIHGDELSSVSIVFKWLDSLVEEHAGDFHWRIAPVMNPDGLLRRRAQRMNARGVDLNRNFPSPNWEEESRDYWVRRTSRDPRRYPGPEPLSEPESRWLRREIERFEPDVIVAVHAPHHVVDFDGPPDPPEQLGSLRLQLLGTYPGSLGRFAGVHLQIPVVTIELPRAGLLPDEEERADIWNDLIHWLEERLPPVGERSKVAAETPEEETVAAPAG